MAFPVFIARWRGAVTAAAVFMVCSCGMPGQIVINEVHGFGVGASPGLQGDYCELFNASSSPIDLVGWSLLIWAGDAGSITPANTHVFPSTPGAHVIPAGGYFLLEESTTPGDTMGLPLSDPTLVGINGCKWGTGSPWGSSSSMGAIVKNPGGTCVDYVYLRRATTPAGAPPNLPAGCNWTPGNVAASGVGFGHIFRLQGNSTHGVGDWLQDATANRGTPGSPNPPRRYQLNRAASSLDVDGAQGTPLVFAQVTRSACTTMHMTLASTNAGLPWDLLLSFSPPVPSDGGGLTTPAGQIVNINLLDPTFGALLGLGFTVPFAPQSVPFTLPAGFGLSSQMVNIDVSSSDGFSLSQPARAAVSVFPSVPGPITNDGTTTVALSNAALCGGPVAVPFYGISYTTIVACANGRVMFGAGSGGNDFTPNVASAIAQSPSAGFWCDLDPSAGGSVSVSVTAPTVVAVTYAGVPYYGNPALTCGAMILIDAALNVVTISGLSTFAPFPPTVGADNHMVLGLSAGDSGPAIDSGQQPFAVGGPHAGPAGAAAVYQFGLAGALAPGVSSLIFIFNGTNYDWTGT